VLLAHVVSICICFILSVQIAQGRFGRRAVDRRAGPRYGAEAVDERIARQVGYYAVVTIVRRRAGRQDRDGVDRG
jgi:hypothetical protein